MSWHSTPLAGVEDVGQLARAGRRTRPAARSAHRAPDRCSRSSAAVKAAAVVPARAVRRRDLADLAGDELQPAAVEGAAERHRDVVAPYQVSSSTVASSPASRSAVASPAAEALACTTRSQLSGALSGAAKAAPSVSAMRGPRRIDIDQRHLRARHAARRAARPAARARRRRPPRSGRPGPGAPSQTALSAVSMLAASTARSGGSAVGQRHDIFGRKVKHGLVRIKREDEAAFQVGRAFLDAAHHRVAIFDGKRKRPAHEWRAHALVFALRHAPAKISRSVPRLSALCDARTRTSPSAGGATGSARISALPGATYQSACA